MSLAVTAPGAACGARWQRALGHGPQSLTASSLSPRRGAESSAAVIAEVPLAADTLLNALTTQCWACGSAKSVRVQIIRGKGLSGFSSECSWEDNPGNAACRSCLI